MDLKTVKNLLNLISESEVNEVEIEEGDFKIKIKKQPDTIYQGGSSPIYMGPQQGFEHQGQPAAPPAPSPAAASQPATSQSSAGSASDETGADDKLTTIRSPIVGTYYTAPSPESEPFISEGDSIAKGDVLCIIEAMKIMNEIESEHSGKIVKMLVKNAQPVEFDQPLFLIEPS